MKEINKKQKVIIKVNVKKTTYPVSDEIIEKAVSLLNIAINLNEFGDILKEQSFVCTNRPDLCNSDGWISGKSVFDEFISKNKYEVSLNIKKLRNPWRRWVSKTKGITAISGREIITYNWWLEGKSKKEVIIFYASHIGHELFHTSYFKFVHNPKYRSPDFVNDKDVTYKIDDIIELLIRQNYS